MVADLICPKIVVGRDAVLGALILSGTNTRKFSVHLTKGSMG